MKNRIFSSTFAALAIALSITACGGGGGSSPAPVAAAPAPVVQPTPPIVVAATTVVIPSGLDQWFHTQQAASDGAETLVMTTMDSLNVRSASAATPMIAIKASDTGLNDVTSAIFEVVPKTFWSRNLTSFIDDTGAQSLYVCNQGREMTSPTKADGTNGTWAEQDRLFVMVNGKYVDRTSSLPQAIDFTHGCTVANMGDGKKSLVKNNLSTSPLKALLTLNNGKYEVSASLDPIIGDSQNKKGTFAVASADFTKTGTDDLVFGDLVVRKTGPASYAVVSKLTPPANYVTAGYTIVHNLVAADVNGDGYPDLIVTYSGNGEVQPGPSFLVGAKFAVYLNDKAGNLVLKDNAIPEAGETEFGLSIRAVDINFDGKLDIVTSGARYIFSNITNPTDTLVKSVLINNGDGTFVKKTLADAELNKQCTTKCQTTTYVLKNADGSFNMVASGKNSAGEMILYSRKVTATTPLTLQ